MLNVGNSVFRCDFIKTEKKADEKYRFSLLTKGWKKSMLVKNEKENDMIIKKRSKPRPLQKLEALYHRLPRNHPALQQVVGFKPETSIQDGLQKFTDWYVAYYNKQ